MNRTAISSPPTASVHRILLVEQAADTPTRDSVRDRGRAGLGACASVA